MYCNRCGGDDHYASRCPNPVPPKVQPKAKPAPGEDGVASDRLAAHTDSEPKEVHGKTSDRSDLGDASVSHKEADTGQADSYCSECGTNLTARGRKRARRQEYMRKYRRDRK